MPAYNRQRVAQPRRPLSCASTIPALAFLGNHAARRGTITAAGMPGAKRRELYRQHHTTDNIGPLCLSLDLACCTALLPAGTRMRTPCFKTSHAYSTLCASCCTSLCTWPVRLSINRLFFTYHMHALLATAFLILIFASPGHFARILVASSIPASARQHGPRQQTGAGYQVALRQDQWFTPRTRRKRRCKQHMP